MKTRYEFTRMAVCPDCIYTAANGPEEVSDEFLDRFRKASERGELIPSCPSDGECGCDADNGYMDEWFSWSACDYCGDRLGGSRVCATFVSEIKA